MAEDKGKEEGKVKAADEKLIAAACEAYGIDKKYVLASAVNAAGQAVVVTVGGSKVRFKTGDHVTPLDPIAVTGVNPKPKRKPITGAAK